MTIKRFLRSLLGWFSVEHTRELDRYLATASNVADVERLLRKWENQQRHNTFHLV